MASEQGVKAFFGYAGMLAERHPSLQIACLALRAMSGAKTKKNSHHSILAAPVSAHGSCINQTRISAQHVFTFALAHIAIVDYYAGNCCLGLCKCHCIQRAVKNCTCSPCDLGDGTGNKQY